nr:hypothetical protein [Tanacetum cinerariifolium]
MHVARLTSDETEARSNLWISSRAYFDGGWSLFIPDTSKQHLLLQYWYANKLATPMPSQPGPSNWQSQMPAQSATPYWQPAFSLHPGGFNWQSPIPSHMGNPNLQPPIERHHDAAGLFNQNILNRGKREQRPSFYKWTPYTKQPPTTILPKRRVNKNENNVIKANLSPLNLRNAFDDENEGGDDGYLVLVTFWQQLVPYLCMPDIDSRTPMGWLSGEHMNA